MLSFSTHDLAPRDRFDHWRDVCGQRLFGVTIELARERRLAFEGSFTSFMVGGAVACDMQASAYHVARGESDIARVAGDSLCISVQMRGPRTNRH